MKRDANGSKVVFFPDIITPGQYYDLRRSGGPSNPLRRLMLAVLQDAIRCFQSTAADIKKSERARFADAEVWLFEENREGPFSFESVCEALELAAPYLRSGLRRWRDQRLAGQSAANRIGRHAPVIPVGRITMNSTDSRRRSRLHSHRGRGFAVRKARGGRGPRPSHDA